MDSVHYWKPMSFKDQNVCFWSDLHLGHDKEFLWGKRGFKSSLEHDKYIEEIWKNYISQETVVFILGDIMFGHNAHQRLLNFLNRVPFSELYIMGGNHHAGYKQLNDESDNGYLYDEFNYGGEVCLVPNYLEIYVNKQPIVLSHYPIVSWNGQSKGSWHLHGHCHGNLVGNPVGNMIYAGKCMDVGVENCPNPISFQILKNRFDKRPKISFDHHDESTKNSF